MKTNNFVLLVIFAFAVIIFMSLTLSCKSYVPYEADPSKLPKYTFEGFRSIIDYSTYQQNDTNKAVVQNTNDDYKKIVGFDGLLSSPDKQDNNLDVYSKASGDVSCKSYGLMNSKGFLCLSPEQVQLLSTRGGNFA
jgi:hypothetical protein